MSVPTCPKCGATRTTRKKRKGFLQTLIFNRLGRFPWQCGECNHRFISTDRGNMKLRKKKRRSSDFDKTLLPMPPTRNVPIDRRPSPPEDPDKKQDKTPE